jgi:hypothetical protein
MRLIYKQTQRAHKSHATVSLKDLELTTLFRAQGDATLYCTYDVGWWEGTLPWFGLLGLHILLFLQCFRRLILLYR